jgi:hypothetical protein
MRARGERPIVWQLRRVHQVFQELHAGIQNRVFLGAARHTSGHGVQYIAPRAAELSLHPCRIPGRPDAQEIFAIRVDRERFGELKLSLLFMSTLCRQPFQEF